MKSILRKRTCLIVATFTALCGASGMLGNTTSTEQEPVGQDRYYDAPGISLCATSEYVTYARYEMEYIETPNNVPYYYTTTLENACGPVGGGIVVGYYDKYFEELIPDFTAYYPATGKYKRHDSTHIPAMMQSLYTLMNTNVVDVGVSRTECLDGLEAYVEGKGLSLTYNSVMGSSFNHTAYKNAINNQQPVLMFCNSVTLVELAIEDTETQIITSQTSTDHIVVGSGYLRLRYFDANDNNFQTDTYLEVATGWTANYSGFIKINNDSWLDAGYAVDIY